jgi:glutaredoxin
MDNCNDEIVVYGTKWCGDTRRATRWLEDHRIQYRWVDIDLDQDGRKFVETTNHGFRSVPTIVFPDGSVLVEPSTVKLAEKFGV